MRLLLYVLFFFIPLIILAQTDAVTTDDAALEDIQIIAYWSKGDVYRFDVTKVDYRTSQGEVTKNDTTNYTGRFEVMDSTATAYTIKWTMEDYSPLSETTSSLMDELGVDLTTGFTDIIYSTNELGVYQQIENLEEIQVFVNEVIAKMLEKPEFNNPEFSPEKMKAIRTNLERIGQRGFIETSMFPELKQLHSVFGGAYSQSDTLRYEDQFFVPLWNGMAKAYGTVYLDTVDVSDDYVHLKQLVDVNETEMKSQLVDYLKTFGPDSTQLDKMMEEAIYSTYEDNDFHFYYFPGIPIYIDCFRHVRMKIEDAESEAKVRLLIEWIE